MKQLTLILLLFASMAVANGQTGFPGSISDRGALLLQDSAALKLFVGPAGMLVKFYADSLHVYSAKEFSHFLRKNSSRINAHKIVMASPKDTPFSALYPYLKALQKKHWYPALAPMSLTASPGKALQTL